MPLSASKEQGIRARKAELPQEAGSEDDDEENDTEMAFDGVSKTGSIVVVWSQLRDVQLDGIDFFFFPVSLLLPQDDLREGTGGVPFEAMGLVSITKRKPVRWLNSGSPTSSLQITLCLCDL